MKHPRTDLPMASPREAVQLHRPARAHRRLWLFYLEHNMFEAALEARRILVGLPRSARHPWRTTLGIAK